MNKHILFKDALLKTMQILEHQPSKQIITHFLTQKLTDHFGCHFTESERLINLMIKHDYLNRTDSFFTVFVSPTDKTFDYFKIDRYKIGSWNLS